jgi:hypothetical protein
LKNLLIILIVVFCAGNSIQAQATRSNGQTPGEIVVKTYPVPAVDHINIELDKDNNTSYTLIIYNFLGRKMYEKQNFARKTTVTLDDFTRGVYIYHLTDLTGRLVKSGKFQVSR